MPREAVSRGRVQYAAVLAVAHTTRRIAGGAREQRRVLVPTDGLLVGAGHPLPRVRAGP
jgi:hypothetical protein